MFCVCVLFILLLSEFLWKSISDQVAHSKFTSFYQIVQLNEFIHSTYLLTIVDGNSVSSNCLDILQTRNSRLSFCMSYSGIGLCTWQKKKSLMVSHHSIYYGFIEEDNSFKLCCNSLIFSHNRYIAMKHFFLK